MHHGLVADVAVGEDDGVDVLVPDDRLEIRLGPIGMPSSYSGPTSSGGYRAIGNPRDLRRGEGDDLHTRIVAVHDVEVVKVAPGRAHDDDSPAVHRGLLSGRGNVAATPPHSRPSRPGLDSALWHRPEGQTVWAILIGLRMPSRR